MVSSSFVSPKITFNQYHLLLIVCLISVLSLFIYLQAFNYRALVNTSERITEQTTTLKNKIKKSRQLKLSYVGLIKDKNNTLKERQQLQKFTAAIQTIRNTLPNNIFIVYVDYSTVNLTVRLNSDIGSSFEHGVIEQLSHKLKQDFQNVSLSLSDKTMNNKLELELHVVI